MKGRFWGLVLIAIFLSGASPRPTVEVSSGKITVYSQGALLSDILDAIGEQANIKFTWIGNEKMGEVPITTEFTDLPLEQGITRLRGRWDYALVKEQNTAVLKEIYVMTRHQTGQEPSSESENRSGPQVLGIGPETIVAEQNPAEASAGPTTSTVDATPGPKEQAEILGHFKAAPRIDSLRSAIRSENSEIRRSAVEAVDWGRVKDPVALDDLQWLATQDPDPTVRGAALEGVIARKEEMKVLPAIVADLKENDPDLHEAAREILDELAETEKVAARNPELGNSRQELLSELQDLLEQQ